MRNGFLGRTGIALGFPLVSQGLRPTLIVAALPYYGLTFPAKVCPLPDGVSHTELTGRVASTHASGDDGATDAVGLTIRTFARDD